VGWSIVYLIVSVLFRKGVTFERITVCKTVIPRFESGRRLSVTSSKPFDSSNPGSSQSIIHEERDDAGLALVAERWAELPGPIRAAILALVRSAEIRPAESRP
jgi:hypothetical protein